MSDKKMADFGNPVSVEHHQRRQKSMKMVDCNGANGVDEMADPNGAKVANQNGADGMAD